MRFLIALAAFAVPSVCISQSESSPMTVAQALAAPDHYLGQRIQLTGILRIVPGYGRLPCPAGVQPCNPIVSVAVFLRDTNDATKQIVVYQSGNPYKCSFDMQGNYKCPPLSDGASIIIEGIYSKGKQPGAVVGSAAPAAGPTPPQTTSSDFYYFDVTSPPNTRPATRKKPLP